MYKTFKMLNVVAKVVTKPETFENILGTVSVRRKHYNPKFKWERGQKVIPIKLPDYHEKMTKEKIRTRLKGLGIMPPRFWRTRPLTITCTSEFKDPYKPPEADGKASILNKEAFASMFNNLKDKKENITARRKIKSYDANFNVQTFPQEAHDLYVKAHTVLMKKDPEELSDYVTEKAMMEMMDGLKFQTLRWKFIESLEAPVVTQVRVLPVLTETNLFGQVTVRFHTKQVLAIYDRFGRLMFGNETVPKDVLEYVVFEKHINNEYGTWRLHGKIIPDWVPSTLTSRTYRVVEVEDDDDDDEYDIVEEQHESEINTNTADKNVSTSAA